MNLSNKHANKRTREAFDAAVSLIGCEPAALQAVIDVEARDRGYDRHGRLIALFEPHRFYALLQKHAPSKLSDAVARGLAYRYQGERPYPKDSYPRIVEAMRIDEELALQATSWGLPQILGENFKDAGYKSAADMVTDFLVGEDEQLTAMARLIVAWGLDEKLRQKDWQGFKNRYNGPKKNDYAARLDRAYSRAKLKGIAIQATTSVIIASGGAGAAANEAGANWTMILVVSGLVALAVAALYMLYLRGRIVAKVETEIQPSAPEIAAEAKIKISAVSGLQEALDHMRSCKAALDDAVAKVAIERTKVAEQLATEKAALQTRIDALHVALEAAEAEAAEVVKETAQVDASAPAAPVETATTSEAQPS